MGEFILNRAKDLYYKHLGYSEEKYPYLWRQCSDNHRQAWILIASEESEHIFEEEY